MENKEEKKKPEDVLRDAQYRKSRSIAFFNATNSAIEILKYSTIQDPIRMKEMIMFWRNWFLDEYTKDYAENIANIGLAFNPAETITKLQTTKSLNDLMAVWVSISEDERQHVDVIKVKNELKKMYEPVETIVKPEEKQNVPEETKPVEKKGKPEARSEKSSTVPNS